MMLFGIGKNQRIRLYLATAFVPPDRPFDLAAYKHRAHLARIGGPGGHLSRVPNDLVHFMCK
jgi:hypothetical protein